MHFITISGKFYGHVRTLLTNLIRSHDAPCLVVYAVFTLVGMQT